MSVHTTAAYSDGPPANDADAADGHDATMAIGSRVLVVEDEFVVAMALETDLQDAGCNVIGVVNSADEAVRVAARDRPDLIVMDIRLVGQRDGVDAALEIYSQTGIRCIFATAHNDVQSKARAALAAPLGWLQKPYSRQTLIDAVQQAMRVLAPKS